MTRFTHGLIALLFLGSSATAAEPPSRGFYVGASVGSAQFDDDGAFNSLNFDDSGTSYGIYGGYKFLRYLAVEARLSNQGSYSIGGHGLAKESFDASALSAHVVGIIPFGKSGWELFGQLGLGELRLDSDCCGNEDNTVGSAGIGVRFYPTPHLGIAVQTDAYAYEDDSFDGKRDIAIAATQFAIHYQF